MIKELKKDKRITKKIKAIITEEVKLFKKHSMTKMDSAKNRNKAISINKSERLKSYLNIENEVTRIVTNALIEKLNKDIKKIVEEF